ncbi:hypothetical protein P167DRAFT_542371 [Morchella conica CCBAS932]|uniref:Uncharacterized protein n=1 Tax=Morchella conica CCBAS932 TaxID=1392247 RepID=A0A3N4L642_9PEZI|nr:hypothetical protein P167DRAFT_542371 [Morchella conica CCBAS932]
MNRYLPGKPTEVLYVDEEEPQRLWDPEGDMLAFNLPYGFGFLAPVVDACHLKALDIKDRYLTWDEASIKARLGVLRDIEREDYSSDILYMDEEELDQLTRHYQQQDIQKNEQYAKAFGLLITNPIPFIAARAWVNWPDTLEILSLISLIISASCVPAVYTDRLALDMPTRWKYRIIRANIYLAGFLAFMAVIFPAGGNLVGYRAAEKYWTNDGSIFGVFPLSMLSFFGGSGQVDGVADRFDVVMALVSHGIRRMMEAVNHLEMAHIRYMYLRPARWEEIGLRAALIEQGVEVPPLLEALPVPPVPPAPPAADAAPPAAAGG